jgi:thiol-disulfide isomerase/thioredoxin
MEKKDVIMIIIIASLLLCLTNMEKVTECASNYLLKKSPKRIKVYWFHTTSCPHCVNMENSWRELTQLYKEDSKRNKKVKLVKINVGNNSYSDIVSKYDSRIKKGHASGGVPNIVMIMPNGKDYTYQGDRSTAHMDSWIRGKPGKRMK